MTVATSNYYSSYEKLLDRIENKRLCCGVIGLGYVGLPLAKLLLSQGFQVLGFDIDNEKIEKLQQNISYVSGISSGDVSDMNNSGLRLFNSKK